jgi:hypothetical protein
MLLKPLFQMSILLIKLISRELENIVLKNRKLLNKSLLNYKKLDNQYVFDKNLKLSLLFMSKMRKRDVHEELHKIDKDRIQQLHKNVKLSKQKNFGYST